MERPRAWMLIVALAACGGGGGDREPPGLVTSATTAPAPIDVGRAAKDGRELARALAQPWRVAAAKLGDHRLTISSTATVKDAASTLEQLGETITIESAAAGPYHATADNTADDGREVIWLDGRLYLRPRYARWHGRGPETDDEPAAIRDQLAAVVGDYVELLTRGLEVSDKGAETVAGRPGHKLEVKLSPSPRPAAREALRQRSWRDTIEVVGVGGEVVLDDELGVALRAAVAGEVTFERDGKRLTMVITVKQLVEAIAAPAITAPAAELVVATPTRSREVDDRNTLLKGIAPPQGKAAIDETAPIEPAPAGPGTGAK